jgi:hypothetical protein
MLHEIITTTDNQFVGQKINIEARPIVLVSGLKTFFFIPDRVTDLGDGRIRLYNSNYTIDVKE